MKRKKVCLGKEKREKNRQVENGKGQNCGKHGYGKKEKKERKKIWPDKAVKRKREITRQENKSRKLLRKSRKAIGQKIRTRKKNNQSCQVVKRNQKKRWKEEKR